MPHNRMLSFMLGIQLYRTSFLIVPSKFKIYWRYSESTFDTLESQYFQENHDISQGSTHRSVRADAPIFSHGRTNAHRAVSGPRYQ